MPRKQRATDPILTPVHRLARIATSLSNLEDAFSLFIIGSFADDLRGFARLAHGITKWFATGAAYLLPNFSALNVISAVAHQQHIGSQLILQNTLYAVFYTAMALSGAVLIFERRNLK